ncbi:hypothetical protein HDU85_000722 [Gaertneriomyces sp. JEL0708]|nr:hypothetical protein HDU85_000722 [Gaertneriomyces sp. JEL0708]
MPSCQQTNTVPPFSDTDPPAPPEIPPRSPRRIPSPSVRASSPSPSLFAPDHYLQFLPLHLLNVSARKLDTQFCAQETTGKDIWNLRKIVLVQNLMTTLREKWDEVGLGILPHWRGDHLDTIFECTSGEEEDHFADDEILDDTPSDDEHFAEEHVTEISPDRDAFDLEDDLLPLRKTMSKDSDVDSGVDVSVWSDEDLDLEKGIVKQSPPKHPATSVRLTEADDHHVKQQVSSWIKGLDFFSDFDYDDSGLVDTEVADATNIVSTTKLEPELGHSLPTNCAVEGAVDISDMLDRTFNLDWALTF